MKKLCNNVYVTKQGAYIHKERETIVINVDRQKVMQLPIHSIAGIYCFGNVTVSPYLMGFCGESGVNLAFFTEYGRFLGRLQGKQTGNVLLRRSQYKASEYNPLDIVKSIIGAKINNSRNVLLRHIRNHGLNPEIKNVVNAISDHVGKVFKAGSVEEIRSIEGYIASLYFGVFNHLIVPGSRDDFVFNGRSRRPPLDYVNALMSFLYSVFSNDISAALQGVGLDPQVGFLHVDRPGRDSLSLDILEEFRAWLIDRLVLSLVNRKQVKPSDFEVSISSGAVTLKEESRKLVLMALHDRKQEEIIHPFIEEKVQIGLIPHLQALLLSRYLRGDLSHYPSFVAR